MLRVASVNVNGIRAAFRRGMDGWLASRDVDVLALQEVRAPTDVLTEHLEPLGWHVAHDLADAAGRAGVAVATRVEPLAVRHGVEADEFAGAGRWVEVDVPTADGGHLTVVSAYVHTGQADDPRQDVKHRFLDAALDRLAKLHADGRPAVLTGDLNVAHTHLDIKNWKGNRGKSGFLPSEQAYLDRLAGELGWVDVARAAAGELHVVVVARAGLRQRQRLAHRLPVGQPGPRRAGSRLRRRPRPHLRRALQRPRPSGGRLLPLTARGSIIGP